MSGDLRDASSAGVTGPSSRSDEIARSWDANAGAWTRAVRERSIESRRIATDAAIVETVVARAPRRVLDVGCGEGWLCRALGAEGIDTVGVDGSAALVEAARDAGGEFHHVSYDELTTSPASVGLSRFDAVTCNFSLLADDVVPLLRVLATMLQEDGAVIIQTVHPWIARGEAGYVDGWRTETFATCAEHFAEPMPWYFRTLASWVETLLRAGLTIERIVEPLNPTTGEPLSLIIVAARAGETDRSTS